MVTLNRIYTKTGDKGSTRLATGQEVSKSDLRVEAYGAVDETNACLGLARLHTGPDADFDAIHKQARQFLSSWFEPSRDLPPELQRKYEDPQLGN